MLVISQNIHVEEFDFKEQFQTFNNYGYASAPDGSGASVGNKWLREKTGGKTVFDTRQSDFAKDLKRRREQSGEGMFHNKRVHCFNTQWMMQTIGKVLGQAILVLLKNSPPSKNMAK